MNNPYKLANMYVIYIDPWVHNAATVDGRSMNQSLQANLIRIFMKLLLISLVTNYFMVWVDYTTVQHRLTLILGGREAQNSCISGSRLPAISQFAINNADQLSGRPYLLQPRV